MAEKSLMDRAARIRSHLSDGSADSIPLDDLRTEVAWQQSAQIIKADAIDPATATRAQLLAAVQGEKIPAAPAAATEQPASAGAEPTTRKQR